jgi:hypothetical protein
VPNPDGSTPWWYPYGFLDPHTAVYGSAFTYIGGILFAFVLLGIAIIGIGRARERHAARHDASRRPPIGGQPAWTPLAVAVAFGFYVGFGFGVIVDA